MGKGGQKEDFQSGFKYMSIACEEGESEGCFNQGLVLITNNESKGVQMDIPKVLYKNSIIFCYFYTKNELFC